MDIYKYLVYCKLFGTIKRCFFFSTSKMALIANLFELFWHWRWIRSQKLLVHFAVYYHQLKSVLYFIYIWLCTMNGSTPFSWISLLWPSIFIFNLATITAAGWYKCHWREISPRWSLRYCICVTLRSLHHCIRITPEVIVILGHLLNVRS